jgi:hypothetical protein
MKTIAQAIHLGKPLSMKGSSPGLSFTLYLRNRNRTMCWKEIFQLSIVGPRGNKCYVYGSVLNQS